MKKPSLFLTTLSLAIPLAGCITIGDDGWKETYGTPTLFLNNVDTGQPLVYCGGKERIPWCYDENLEIRDILLASGPYAESKRIASDSDRYITYYLLRSNSTAGPNYCALMIYGDGFVTIDYKSALASHHYANFTMDETQANDLIDQVEPKVAEAAKSGESA